MNKPDVSPRVGTPDQRGTPLTFYLDGEPCLAYAGETIAGAMVAAGRVHFRRSSDRHEWRGYYCGMGVCWECVVVVDGCPNVRACATFVREGMRVETQDGDGPGRSA